MSKEIVSAEVHFTPQSNNIIDRRLIRAAASGHRSGNALAEAINFLHPPEWCLNRLLEILDENDILSEANDRRLLVLNARDIMESVRQDYESGRGMKGNAANAKVLLDSMKLIDEITNRIKIDINLIEFHVNNATATAMVDAYHAGLETLKKELPPEVLEMIDVDGVYREAVEQAIERHAE